jgi:hypothetical protein
MYLATSEENTYLPFNIAAQRRMLQDAAMPYQRRNKTRHKIVYTYRRSCLTCLSIRQV